MITAPLPPADGMPETPIVYPEAVCVKDWMGITKWCDAVVKHDYDALRAYAVRVQAENEKLKRDAEWRGGEMMDAYILLATIFVVLLLCLRRLSPNRPESEDEFLDRQW